MKVFEFVDIAGLVRGASKGEGLGNQLFMFANSYFLAKVKKCTLMIDDESGYFKNKKATEEILENM